MPQKISSLFTQAINAHQLGDNKLALEIYEKILASNPHDTNPLHLIAILYAQEKKYDLALKYIERALTISPSATLHNSAGNIFKNLHQLDQAQQHYQKSLALEPNCAAYNNLGIIYYQLQQYDKAMQNYQAALKLDPTSGDSYFNLGLVAEMQNNLDEAKDYFTQTLKLNPQHSQAHYQLALICQRQEKNLTAIYHYQKTLRLAPNYIPARQNLGALLLKQGKPNLSLRHFKKILALDPKHIDSYHNLGAIFLQQKNPNTALKYFLQLSQLSKDPVTYYNLGIIYFELKMYQDAIIYFNEALRFDQKNVAILINLAAIYLKKEDYLNAILYYEKILNIDPNHQEAKYLISALKGENTTAAPLQYVQHLFDNYAENFDQHLALLKYNTPQLLYDAVIKTCGNITNLDILDLGCGTGLIGEKFKSLTKNLIGIDLSSKMIEIARNKNIYNRLEINDIFRKKLNYTNIDLIIIADTLVYIGDLEQIFINCTQTLKPSGFLVFTIEQTSTYPYILQKTARFAHSVKYIENLCDKYQFFIAFHDQIIARKQKETDVIQDLFILKNIK